MRETGRASIPLVGGMLVAVTAIAVWTLTRPAGDSLGVSSPEVATDVATSVPTDTPQNTQSAAESESAVQDGVAASVPSEVVSEDVSGDVSGASGPTTSGSESSDNVASAADTFADDAGLSQDELSEIGTAAYSDGEFELLKQLILEQPAVLAQLLEEFRANTDPDRAGRLAELLGQFQDQSITDIGAEMAFSGDLASQKAGLDLLGRQQPRSAAARGVVTQVLEVESNPDVLVPALNAISRSTRVDSDEQRHILNQLSTLSTHQDPRVRSHSFALMKGWSKDVNMNAELLLGLEDPNDRVRESATFSLVNTEFPTDEVKLALLSRLEDDTEKKSIREGSFNALRRFNLSLDEQARLDAALKLLNQ